MLLQKADKLFCPSKKNDSTVNLMKYLIVFLFPFINFAQTTNNLEYFPYQTGDMWEFTLRSTDWPINIDTLQSFMHYDSTDNNGNVFATKTSRYINPIVALDTMHYMIDTLNQVWGKLPRLEILPDSENIVFLKLNAAQGDKWVMRTDSINGDLGEYEMARVISISEQLMFGNMHTAMSIHYYITSDSTDTLNYIPDIDFVHTYVKGFGLVSYGGASDIMEPRLNGFVIDGILYGDTTGVITSVEDFNNNIPSTFTLKQNYPNPFNPSTTIKYSIPFINKAAPFLPVQLKIYDILGREVSTLVNENEIPGNYSVKFSTTGVASNLSSGIYLYKLTVGNLFTKSKKMILLK